MKITKEQKQMEIEAIWKVAKAFKVQQHESELKDLVSLLYNHKEKHGLTTILEIGAYDGGTTVSWLRLAEKVVSIDLQHRIKIPESVQISGSSFENDTFMKVLEHIQPKTVDFLFIDGDHTGEGSMKDFEIYSQFVKNGGLIAFHDINNNHEHSRQNCFVSKTWETLKNVYKHVEFVHDKNSWGGIGVLWFKD